MFEYVQIPLADLLPDDGNPRLVDTAASQQETALALARQQGDNLVRLAADIVENGLDPTTIPAVVATADRRKRYRVVEGNRRILVLRALETPALVSAVQSQRSARKLTQLAARYVQNPIAQVPCVFFESMDDAEHWVELRHTGMNQGSARHRGITRCQLTSEPLRGSMASSPECGGVSWVAWGHRPKAVSSGYGECVSGRPLRVSLDYETATALTDSNGTVGARSSAAAGQVTTVTTSSSLRPIISRIVSPLTRNRFSIGATAPESAFF
jgi:hypothetical protein